MIISNMIQWKKIDDTAMTEKGYLGGVHLFTLSYSKTRMCFLLKTEFKIFKPIPGELRMLKRTAVNTLKSILQPFLNCEFSEYIKPNILKELSKLESF